MSSLPKRLWEHGGPGVARLIPGAAIAVARRLSPTDVEDLLDLDRGYLHAGRLPNQQLVAECLDGSLPIWHENGPAYAQQLIDRIAVVLPDPGSWREVSDLLECLVITPWDGSDQLIELMAELDAKPDEYFRWYPLNQGKNDHWEYYLVPWVRTYRTIFALLQDYRFRGTIGWSLWRRFDRWYQTERPWMIQAVVGSNIGMVIGGYALHALLGTILVPERQMEYADEYIDYARRLHKTTTALFSGDGIPHEGISYGLFAFVTAAYLGILQDRMELAYGLLDIPVLSFFMEYLEAARTHDGFLAAGDHTNAHCAATLVAALARRGNPTARRVLPHVALPDALLGNIDV